jgi:hypothetical protein
MILGIAVNGVGVVVVKGMRGVAGEITVNVEVEMDTVSVHRLIFVVCDVGWEREGRRVPVLELVLGREEEQIPVYIESWSWNGRGRRRF